MATRIVCDQCGNDIPSREEVYKYVVRPTSLYEEDDDEDDTKPTKKKRAAQAKPFYVELCVHCDPVWTQRVQKLTKASDPKNGD